MTTSRTSEQTLVIETAPPHSIEAEVAVLGSMLIDREAVIKALDLLKQEDFYRPIHQEIFRIIQRLYDQQIEADVVTVGEALRNSIDLSGLGNANTLIDITGRVPTALHVEHYARIVKWKSILRNLIKASRDVMGEAQRQPDDVLNLLDKAQEQFFALGFLKPKGDAADSAHLMHEAVEILEKMVQSGQMVTGVPTGYTELDNLTSGFQPANLAIVAGRPSMGKTALCLNIAEHVAVEKKLPVLFFSLEMSAQEMGLRLLCSRAHLNVRDIRRGYLARKNWPRITSTASEIAEAPLYFDFATSPTALELRSAARRKAHELARKGTPLSLIIIDYMQLMQGSHDAENRQQEISEISRSLKALARELKVPIIALSQLNRRPEERGREGRPQLSDLRESGAIEQDADLVMAIYREEVYRRDDPDLKGRAKVFILKQRNGPVGDVELTFLEECTRFVSPEKMSEPVA
jgi:replicative DNA helicase